MVHFVGAGCGAPDLITLRGRRLLEEADVIIYAGSLVNPALLGFAKKDCRIYNSAQMTLEEVIAVMEEAESRQQMTVRLHTGDPSLYGAIREQIDCLKQRWMQNTHCRALRKASSLRGWRGGRRCRKQSRSPPLRRTAARWSFS